jgi:hypothetical protein
MLKEEELNLKINDLTCEKNELTEVFACKCIYFFFSATSATARRGKSFIIITERSAGLYTRAATIVKGLPLYNYYY